MLQRSLPHGHVVAVLGLCRQLSVPRLLGRTASWMRELALAAPAARVLSPASKLATARQLSPDTAAFSLGAALGLGAVSGNEVLNMLDWLLKRQPWIERALARRYLKDGTVVLYDMTSSYPARIFHQLFLAGVFRRCWVRSVDRTWFRSARTPREAPDRRFLAAAGVEAVPIAGLRLRRGRGAFPAVAGGGVGRWRTGYAGGARAGCSRRAWARAANSWRCG